MHSVVYVFVDRRAVIEVQIISISPMLQGQIKQTWEEMREREIFQ